MSIKKLLPNSYFPVSPDLVDSLQRYLDAKIPDDERKIGNGILVTLKAGNYFYDDCGVMGFDTPREALAATNKAQRKVYHDNY